VSIARRLQDPLAELVKIDPKAIGVGQYQHDVDQNALARSLDGVVEDCVNAVGVDVNMASAALLGAGVAIEQRGRQTTSSHIATSTVGFVADAAEEGSAHAAESVRAGCGIPAHFGQRRSAGCVARSTRRPIRCAELLPRSRDGH